MESKGLHPQMPQPSRLERFLKSFPEEQREHLKQEILRCGDSKAAYIFLRDKYRYSGSYDSVKSWRKSNSQITVDSLATHAANVARIAASQPTSADPTEMVVNLSQELAKLCLNLTALLNQHEWLEPGEVRLTDRQASKLLSTLPGLSRAAAGSIVELYKIKAEVERRDFARGLAQEILIDCRRALEVEDANLIPVFESVVKTTMARLEIDRESVLEKQLTA